MEIWIYVFRIFFIVLIYLFLFEVIFILKKDLYSENKKLEEEPFEAELLILKGKDKIKSFSNQITLSKSITLGRDISNDIVIEDQFVSNLNTRIFYKSGSYHIEDLNSTNGTWLNSERVSKIIALKDSDIITLGEVEFKFTQHQNLGAGFTLEK